MRPAVCAFACRLLAAAAAAVAVAVPARAHGFGQRYDLPLPLPLYLFGAAAAVVVSFLIFGLFVRRTPEELSYPRADLFDYRLGRLIAGRPVRIALQLISAGLLLLIVAAGFWGQQNPYQNIAPTMVWVIGWVGLAYVSAFVGDLWELINPWRTLFVCGQSAYRRATRGRELPKSRSYPELLGVWPAFLLLLAFSWTELVYPHAAVPSCLGWLIVGYSVLTWTAMAVFGAETWLRHGELFSVVFGILARFAPLELRRTGPGKRMLALRPFAVGLLDAQPSSLSMTALVLLILSSVIFDGLIGSPEWSEFESGLAAAVPSLGDVGPIAVRTAGLIAAWAVFFGAYLAVCAIVSAVTHRHHSALRVAQDFALTLVPIAIAYHIAHYFVYLLIQGQYILPLMSDPFGYGWDLLGTAGYRVDIGIVGARFAWYTAVAAIVCGHVVAVWLAHVRAMQIFRVRSAALRSQVPLTALMVVYTLVSLSILAEPLTERRASAPTEAASAAIEVPPDALLPEVASGRLQRVGAGRIAKTKMTYRVLGSAFHDGTRMDAADLLYAYAFAYCWSAPDRAGSRRYDPLVDSATANMREHLVGFRVIGTDTVSKSFRVAGVEFLRELWVIEVYTTLEPQDPEQAAAVAPPWSTIPWHVLVLMEEAVTRGWGAFSQAEAARRGVEWLDLARSDSIKKQLASLVETFEREGYRPETLRPLVSRDEARKRWAAVAAFYQAHGHFLITNGPYQLKSWSRGRVELEAFRDLSYPLGVGSYDAYAIPRRAFVSKVERDNNRLRLFGSAETLMKYQRSYELVRQPLQAVESDVLKRSSPECRYVVVDSQARVVQAGSAGLSEDATFYIDLDSRLTAGTYTVLAEITLNRNAMNADIRRIPVVIASPGDRKGP
jgi:hypothetical protein